MDIKKASILDLICELQSRNKQRRQELATKEPHGQQYLDKLIELVSEKPLNIIDRVMTEKLIELCEENLTYTSQNWELFESIRDKWEDQKNQAFAETMLGLHEVKKREETIVFN